MNLGTSLFIIFEDYLRHKNLDDTETDFFC